jgi:hypothetical protein
VPREEVYGLLGLFKEIVSTILAIHIMTQMRLEHTLAIIIVTNSL